MDDYISRQDISSAKFHPLPYTHIVPSNVDEESYKTGWNDALDSVIQCAPAADVQPITLESAIDYLHKIGWMQDHDRQMTQMSADVQPIRWIPCSERMPVPMRGVLITVFFHGIWRTLWGYRDDGKWMYWLDGFLFSTLGDDYVTAWMEIPKPYEGSE